MRVRRIGVVLAAATVAGLLVSMPTAAAAAKPYCGLTWGSLPKSATDTTEAPVVGARVGRHDCWDRLVIDLGGQPAAGFNVRYVDHFWADGSGETLPVAGGAILRIIVQAPAYTPDYSASTVPWKFGSHIVSTSNFRTFRDLVYGGSFEGQTVFGLGVRARLPFRVFTLDGPGGRSRLVIDVAHKW